MLKCSTRTYLDFIENVHSFMITSLIYEPIKIYQIVNSCDNQFISFKINAECAEEVAEIIANKMGYKAFVNPTKDEITVHIKCEGRSKVLAHINKIKDYIYLNYPALYKRMILSPIDDVPFKNDINRRYYKKYLGELSRDKTLPDFANIISYV
jgi:hypothetical protein